MNVQPRFVLSIRPWRSPAFDASFAETEHPRGQPENKGQFAKKGQGGGGSHKPGKHQVQGAKPSSQKNGEHQSRGAKSQSTSGHQISGAVTLSPVKDRAWSGKTNEGATRLGKQEAGRLGEQIVVAWLKSLGIKDARPMNVQKANFPVDMIGDHQVHEVKTGQITNSAAAAQWRATIGQPGKAETEALKQMTPEQKAAHNAAKNAAIMRRKQAIVDEYSKKLGHKISPKTITVILDPDRGIADIHRFEGFHHRIGYNSDQARQGYVGSFKYR